jgi:pyruvate/2-oxoacid:ferredoxin oxidoreductase beta subunit/Pyruvate/2-oxoacid:ferredoxin oxidoreductase delta subunit
MNPITPLDVKDFESRILAAYGAGTADEFLPADDSVARSLVPPGTGAERDFSTIAPELPLLDPSACVGCMECVTACPDSAILAKVVPTLAAKGSLLGVTDEAARARRDGHLVNTSKYGAAREKKGEKPGLFALFVDPVHCKGCGECVEVCGSHQALRMAVKTDTMMAEHRDDFAFYRSLPPTPPEFINEKILPDLMLGPGTDLYAGGAGSCMGCGEATAVRMMLAATGFQYGHDFGILAATGCNSVFGATYPYNPYRVPWSNSLFENVPAFAMGVRAKWDQEGKAERRLWAVGGDGAMLDIGFQSLSRLLMSGMDIKVLVLDTQVYSNTGGQASTGSFMSQDAKMASIGKSGTGKRERRKELAQIALMHPHVFIAQTTPAHTAHFYRAVMAANEYPGPAIVNVYTTCQPEHGVADDMSNAQSKLAVECRAFPLLVHDPRKGGKLRERISLAGNPAPKEDWAKGADGTPFDFIRFARTEQRFAKHLGKDGMPDASLLAAQEDRLENWRLLQELAGLR